MNQFFVPRSSFTIHIPDTGLTGHMCVIVTDTCAAGKNLIVPVCSASGLYDNSCILLPGDHEFIKHKSYIAYRHLNQMLSNGIREKVLSGVIEPMGLLDQKVFESVCIGIETSDEVEPIHLKYYLEQRAILKARSAPAEPAMPLAAAAKISG